MRADDRLPSELYFPSRLVSPPAKWEEGDRTLLSDALHTTRARPRNQARHGLNRDRRGWHVGRCFNPATSRK